MTPAEIEEGLRTLGYGRKWTDYGFLEPETLRQQLMIYETGEDRDKAHYRYAAFCHVLERPGLDDGQIAQLLELVDEEPDPSTVGSVKHLLVWWRKLTPGQRSALRAHPQFAEGCLQREFAIFDLSWQLDGATIEDALYEQCLATGDETLQRQIVEHPGVTKAQVERLAETGKSKSVRNMAVARLKRFEKHSLPPSL